MDRNYRGETVNGLTFTTISDATAGGRQIDGFHGLSIEYLRSKKLLQADGGWDRIVWLPKSVKERVKDFMPAELVDKVATEEEVKNVDELRQFLTNNNHPITQRWAAAAAETQPKTPETIETGQSATLELPPETLSVAGLGSGLTLKITLKDAKITIKKLIIKPEREK